MLNTPQVQRDIDRADVCIVIFFVYVVFIPPPTHADIFFFCVSHQSTVNGDSLAGSLSCGSCAFEPLRACQVHKVELGHQCLVLRLGDGAGVHAVQLPILSSSILQAKVDKKQLRIRLASKFFCHL